MTSLTDISPSDELYLYVAFHIADDVNSAASIARLLRFMDEEFGQLQSKVLESESIGAREVIFRVAKPLMHDENAQEEFFEKLREIFTATTQHHPHFTQLSQEVSRGITHD